MNKYEKLRADIYDFARERYDSKNDSIIPSEKWKKTGELNVLSELLRFIKHYEDQQLKHMNQGIADTRITHGTVGEQNGKGYGCGTTMNKDLRQEIKKDMSIDKQTSQQ